MNDNVRSSTKSSTWLVWLIRALPIVGFFCTLLCFYPGFMSFDSLSQYRQSLAHSYSDAHPASMAVLWSVLNVGSTGPQLMLLLQLLAYWGSVHLVLSTRPTRVTPWTSFAVILIAFSPAILNFVGVVWKDVQLASAWSLSAAYLYSRRHTGRGDRLFVVKTFLAPLVTYGALVRWNSGVVAGPIALYCLTGRCCCQKRYKTVILYFSIALLAVAAGAAFDMLAGVEKTAFKRTLPIFDLAAISVATGTNQFPFQLTEQEFVRMSECGTSEGVDPLLSGSCSFLWSKAVAASSDLPIVKAWLSSILNNPAEYLEHRIEFFRLFLNLGTPNASSYIWQDGIIENEFGLEVWNKTLAYTLQQYVSLFGGVFLFRPIFWLLLSLVFVWIGTTEQKSATANFVQTLGIVSAGYILSYLVVGIAFDFRYIYLAVQFCSFGCIALLLNGSAIARVTRVGTINCA
jgi:hypothetical protein